MALDPLQHLARDDKWYLANGRGAMYAPTFPRFLDSPGFWDPSYVADLPLERLFTVLVVDERLHPVTFHTTCRAWRPDRFTVERSAGDLDCREERVIIGEHLFASRLTLTNRGDRGLRLHLAQWSLQSAAAARGDARAPERDGCRITYARRQGEALAFGLTVRRAGAGVELHAAMGASAAPTSHTINLSEGHDTAPLWATSIFPEKLRAEGLPDEDKLSVGTPAEGLVHLGLHYAVELPPGESRQIAFACAVSTDGEYPARAVKDLAQLDAVADSEEAWRRFFASVPYFECDDPHLTTYYWYRWYGLRLLMVAACEGLLPYPCVFEGIDGFRCHISYSAQCHMLECSWMEFPQFAQGSLLNFVENQLASGSFPGHIGLAWHDQGFYHANWGAGALQVYYLSGDKGFLKAMYEGLCRYAEYFARERDPEGSHLYDVINQGETGQEYSSRYLFADPEADTWKAFRLKGVDATVYLYELQRSLAEIAAELELPEAERRWRAEADATRQAVRERMWDPQANEFRDVLPGAWERSPYSAAVGFYPFTTDIAGREHLGALRHLLNPHRFWTEFPTPTSPCDDPYFSAQAEWKGRRHACPWNGRVWPMTNSHVCQALARAAQHLDPALAEPAAEALRRFVRMMFHHGDPRRPNCFEHYNPHTGMPCLYRGVDDYQHSWVVDLIIKYAAGLQPQRGGGLAVHPLPLGLAHFTLERVRMRGREVKVTWRAPEMQAPEGGLRIYIDGALRARAAGLERIELNL